MEILTRLFIALLLIALGVGLYWAWQQWQLRRLRPALQRIAPGLEQLRPGTPAVLYFTAPDCVPCRTVQRPAIERLQAELQDQLQVIEIDATAQPEVADHWGVLTVPTTFVLDAYGQPRHINHGVTPQGKLKQQVESSKP